MNTDPFGFPASRIHRVSRTHKPTNKAIDSIPTQSHSGNEPLRAPAAIYPIRSLLFISVAVVLFVLVRAFQLQVVSGHEYRERAEGNRIYTRITKALRGVVYDTDGNLLVKNIPNFRLVVNAADIPKQSQQTYEESLERIRALSGIPREEFDALLLRSRTTGQGVVLREHIPYNEALQLMVQTTSQPGANIETFYSREYAYPDALSHVLGYTGSITEVEYAERSDAGYLLNDELGKTGIEKFYEQELRGEDGYENNEVDNRGKKKSVVSKTDPVAGNNLRLTIDSSLQESLYGKLKQAVDERGVPGAAAVAMDPRDGSIRALVSYPSFNNNTFAQGISSEEYQRLTQDERQPLFNRAISGTYPSGSTFKPIVAAAALEEKVITPSTTVNSTGGIRIGNFFFPDWRAGGHGVTNVFKALADSVNTFFYLAGGGDNETSTGLGVDRITEYGRRFGLASPTGIDVPGEASGFLPSKAWKEEFKNEPWYIGDTYHLAIGQGDILVTPLQVAVYTSVFANGGTLYKPHVVQEMTDQENQLVKTIGGEVMNPQVVSQESITVVRNGLREAVLSGSARSLLSLPVTSAGKTGTAQFGEDQTHSWFTAFAPFENPELVIVVLVEKAGGGNDSAVPIARETLQEYFSR